MSYSPQVPLSMSFPKQEHWSGLQFPSPRDFLDPGTEPMSPAFQVVSCIAGGFFTDWTTRETPSPKNVPIVFLYHSSIQCSVVSNSLRSHESLHARPLCPSPTPGVYSNSCPLNRWCHPAISSSVIPFSSRPQSLPASGSFPMIQLFAWGGQSIGASASASVLPVNTQDWSPLGWTGWISLQSKGLSRVFSNTTVQKHQFFGTQLSSQSNSHIHNWPLEKL